VNRERFQKSFRIAGIATAGLISLGIIAVAAADDTQWYGRAGGPVGAGAIQWIGGRATPSAASPSNANPFDGVYGRAGGPVGADAIRTLAQRSAPSAPAPDWVAHSYGRAGGPVGADAIHALSERGAAIAGHVAGAHDRYPASAAAR
jgi:hypothetical protein